MQIKEILKYCETTQLHQFIIEYAKDDAEFKKELISRLGPQKISETKEDYVGAILSAFGNNSIKNGNRYRGWDDFGFDAMDSYAHCVDVIDDIDMCNPYVVIIDIDMPGINGIEGGKTIRKKFPNFQILTFTVFDDDKKVFAAIKRARAAIF